MSVHSEENPSNVKPYRHPHYQGRFQGRQEGGYQHYRGIRCNSFQYSWNKASQNHYLTRYYHRPTSTKNCSNFNKNTWNQGK
jgi:hypothetical protein